MADNKKLSMKAQKAATEDYFNGKERPADEYMNKDTNGLSVGAGQGVVATKLNNEDPQDYRNRMEQQGISAMQAQNAMHPELTAKINATNDAVQRYNEQMKMKLMQAMQARQQGTQPAAMPPGSPEQYPAMEGQEDPQAALKQALMRKMAGNQQ